LSIVRAASFALLLTNCGSYVSVDQVTRWLRVEHTRPLIDLPHLLSTGPAATSRVLRQTDAGWVEVPAAGRAAGLAGDRHALLEHDGGRDYLIIDEQGHEVARLPCASWRSPDRRRVYCLRAPSPVRDRPEDRHLTVQGWSDDGVSIGESAAAIPLADRSGFYAAGV